MKKTIKHHLYLSSSLILSLFAPLPSSTAMDAPKAMEIEESEGSEKAKLKYVELISLFEHYPIKMEDITEARGQDTKGTPNLAAYGEYTACLDEKLLNIPEFKKFFIRALEIVKASELGETFPLTTEIVRAYSEKIDSLFKRKFLSLYKMMQDDLQLTRLASSFSKLYFISFITYFRQGYYAQKGTTLFPAPLSRMLRRKKIPFARFLLSSTTINMVYNHLYSEGITRRVLNTPTYYNALNTLQVEWNQAYEYPLEWFRYKRTNEATNKRKREEEEEAVRQQPNVQTQPVQQLPAGSAPVPQNIVVNGQAIGGQAANNPIIPADTDPRVVQYYKLETEINDQKKKFLLLHRQAKVWSTEYSQALKQQDTKQSGILLEKLNKIKNYARKEKSLFDEIKAKHQSLKGIISKDPTLMAQYQRLCMVQKGNTAQPQQAPLSAQIPQFNGEHPPKAGAVPQAPRPQPFPGVAVPPAPRPQPFPGVAVPPAPRPQPLQAAAAAPAPRPQPFPGVAVPPAPCPQPFPEVAVPPAPRSRPFPRVAVPPAPRPQPLQAAAAAPAPRPQPFPGVAVPPAPCPQPFPEVAVPPAPRSRPFPRVAVPPAPRPQPFPGAAVPPAAVQQMQGLGEPQKTITAATMVSNIQKTVTAKGEVCFINKSNNTRFYGDPSQALSANEQQRQELREIIEHLFRLSFTKKISQQNFAIAYNVIDVIGTALKENNQICRDLYHQFTIGKNYLQYSNDRRILLHFEMSDMQAQDRIPAIYNTLSLAYKFALEHSLLEDFFTHAFLEKVEGYGCLDAAQKFILNWFEMTMEKIKRRTEINTQPEPATADIIYRTIHEVYEEAKVDEKLDSFGGKTFAQYEQELGEAYSEAGEKEFTLRIDKAKEEIATCLGAILKEKVVKSLEALNYLLDLDMVEECWQNIFPE